MNEQQGMQDLQQMGSLMQLQQAMQNRQRQTQEDQRGEALRARIAALPPEKRNAENILPIIKEFGSPMEALKMESDVENRKVAREQQAFQFVQAHDLKQQALDQQKELALSRAADKASQDAINNSFKERQLVLDQQNKQMMQLFAQQNIDIKKMMAGQKADGGLTPENAGKVAMSQQAVDGIGTVRGIVFDKDGKLNRGVVGAMNLPIVSGLPGNSQARIARSAIRNAIEAKLRIETGAAATESEVERTLARFLPTISDTDTSAKFKLEELEKFFKTSLSLTKGITPPAKPTNDPLGIR
jgi:hypothetical protein